MICFLSAKHTLPLIGEVEFELIIFALWQCRGKQARRLTLYVIYKGLDCYFFKFKWDILSMAAGCGDCVPYPAKSNPCSFPAYSDFSFHLNSKKENYYNNLFKLQPEQCVFSTTRPMSRLEWLLLVSSEQSSNIIRTFLKLSVLSSWFFLSWCSLAQGPGGC